RRALPPRGGIANAGVIDGVTVTFDFALLLFVRHRHPLREADGHAPFFRVTQHEWLVVQRVNRDLVIEKASFGLREKADEGFIATNVLSIGSEPAVPRSNGPRVSFNAMLNRFADDRSFV